MDEPSIYHKYSPGLNRNPRTARRVSLPIQRLSPRDRHTLWRHQSSRKHTVSCQLSSNTPIRVSAPFSRALKPTACRPRTARRVARGVRVPPGPRILGPSQANILHPTPYTLLTPYTLHPTPYALHPTPYTPHSTPYILHPTSYTLHPTPFTLNAFNARECGQADRKSVG